jgi:DNA-binding GntR family transcriptional regulator
MRDKGGKIRTKLRREIIHGLIRSRIVKGELPAGTRLSEVELADSMKASRTPVREALIQLQEEGLLEIVPRRGPVVRHISPHEMAELLMIRESLEALAANWASTRMTESELEALHAEWEEVQRNVSMATRDAIFEKCEEFHQVLIAGARSAILNKLVGTIRDRISSARQTYLRAHGGHPEVELLQLSCSEHLKIIEALQARDAPLCEQLIRHHLRGIAREILESASKQFIGYVPPAAEPELA